MPCVVVATFLFPCEVESTKPKYEYIRLPVRWFGDAEGSEVERFDPHRKNGLKLTLRLDSEAAPTCAQCGVVRAESTFLGRP